PRAMLRGEGLAIESVPLQRRQQRHAYGRPIGEVAEPYHLEPVVLAGQAGGDLLAARLLLAPDDQHVEVVGEAAANEGAPSQPKAREDWRLLDEEGGDGANLPARFQHHDEELPPRIGLTEVFPPGALPFPGLEHAGPAGLVQRRPCRTQRIEAR